MCTSIPIFKFSNIILTSFRQGIILSPTPKRTSKNTLIRVNSILMFIFSKFLSFIFWGQIWFQNLKFSKLPQICYRDTLLYNYYDFNVFLNICHSYIFEIIWSQNLKFSNSTEICYGGTLLCAYYDFHVYFFKDLFIHIFWANLVRKSEVLQIAWNLVHCCMFVCLWRFNVCFFKIFVIHFFGGIFGLKIWSSPN